METTGKNTRAANKIGIIALCNKDDRLKIIINGWYLKLFKYNVHI